MNRKRVVIVGAGGHALVVIDILEQMGNFEIIGLLAPRVPEGKIIHGYPVIGDDNVLPDLLSDGLDHVAVGVGGFRNNLSRILLFNRLKESGFSIVTAVHPRSCISPRTTIGEGCCVFAGVTINPNCSIGHNTIIATNSSIDHETTIERNALISAGCSIGGNVHIGEGALVAIGATVVSGVKIGAGALVAAGAVVIKNVKAGEIVAGIPAQPTSRIKCDVHTT